MITTAWSHERVTIPSVFQVSPDGQTTSGCALLHRVDGHRHAEMLYWEARVTRNGWEVVVRTDSTGRQTMWTGATLNMLLEVAAAVRMH